MVASAWPAERPAASGASARTFSGVQWGTRVSLARSGAPQRRATSACPKPHRRKGESLVVIWLVVATSWITKGMFSLSPVLLLDKWRFFDRVEGVRRPSEVPWWF